MMISRQNQKNTLCDFHRRVPPLPGTQHTIFTRWFTAFTTHHENLSKALVQLVPTTLSTTGHNMSSALYLSLVKKVVSKLRKAATIVLTIMLNAVSHVILL